MPEENKTFSGSLVLDLRILMTSRAHTTATKGPITWRISARAEISARLLKQILLKSNCRLHGVAFSPGRNSSRAENPSPG